MIKNIVLFFISLIPFVGITQKTLQSPEQFITEIDETIPELLKDFSIPGAAIAIIKNGEIVLQKCYGFADIEKGIKVTKKTGFNIGSISKTVAAWGVMKLVEEGKLDLDTPVENYLTRWHLPKSSFDSDKVTVRRLLSHTAGLSLPSVSAEHSFDDLPTITEWLNGKNEGLGGLEIILEPATKWEYSGGGYGLIQLIIEEVSGQTFEDYMQQEVLNPLGMQNSSFKIDEKVMSASATPYDKFGKPSKFGLYTVQAAAGLHTTLEDFIRFAFASLPEHEAHKKINTVLPPETVQKMLEPAPNTTIGGWKYGLGYQSVHMDDSRIFIGHTGSNTGWQANFRIEPTTNTGFIVLTNGSAGDNICNPMFCKLINWTSSEPSDNNCWRKLSINNKLVEAIDKNGIENVAMSYAVLKEEHPNKYDFSESQLNDLGYYYVGQKDFEKAITIFKLNIEVFPYAYNVYDSYGETLLAQGAREEAIKNYKKSIQLNPDNENGIRVLKNLGVPTDDILLKVPIEQLKRLEGEYVGTHDESWRIVVKVNNGVLDCEDKYYKFTLIPIGEDKYVNPKLGALWRFDMSIEDTKPTMLFGKLKFEKVK